MLVFVTHPVRYFVPILRQLANVASMDLTVHFVSDHGVTGRVDRDFGSPVSWDIPLLSGYRSAFLSRNADVYSPVDMRLTPGDPVLHRGMFDALMIHGHTRPFERQLIAAARATGTPILMRGEFSDRTDKPRGPIKQIVRDVCLRNLYRKIDAFCVIGIDASNHLARLGVARNRMFHSPYSVDDEMIAEQRRTAEVDDCRRELGIEPGRLVVLFSGKFIKRKRPYILLRALERLDKTSFSLIMIGDGELWTEISSQAQSMFGSQAILPGFVNQSELGRYFRASDVLVLPSAFDTWGLVINEAMHFGLPAIVSNAVGCAADLVREGDTGFTFPLDDIGALARKLRLLSHDLPLVRRMGANASQLIAEYTVDRSVAGIVRALEYVST